MKIRVDILRGDLRRSARMVSEGANRLHSRAGRAILNSLVNGTRVDTGKAVSNWRVGIGQPTRAEIEAHNPGKKGSTAEENRQATLVAGLDRISSKTAGQEIFISNNVSYLKYVPRIDETVDNAMTAGRMALGSMKVL